jgi:uncharacterized membrane protein
MPRLMRLGRRLLLLVTATAVATAFVAAMYSSQAIRAISGILMVFLLPGYLLTRLLWPGRGQIPGVWRLSLIVPGSILAVGGALLLLSYFRGYQPERAFLVGILLNAALAICAYVRCKGASADEACPQGPRLSSNLSRNVHHFTRWHALSGLAAVVLVGSIAYAMMTPRQIPSYTEFYLLTEGGHLPAPGGSFRDFDSTLRCVIRNHEGQPMEYRLSVVAVTSERRSELWSQFVIVAEGSAVQAAVDLSAAPPDSREILWLLFLTDRPEPYQSLRLVLY